MEKQGGEDVGFRKGRADMTALGMGYHVQDFSPDFDCL
jgi:hypothetical protein